MEWYVNRNGVQEGPYSQEQMKVIVEQHVLQPNDLVWRVGMNEWTLASSVAGLIPPPPTPLQRSSARTAVAQASSQSPQAETESRAANGSVPSELEAALKDIKNAWIAALVSAGFTLLFVLLSFFVGHAVAGIDGWALLDAAVIVGLGYGVHRKSRACAILLFALFLLEKLFMMSIGNASAAGIGVAIVWGWFYFKGILGTFRYRSFVKSNNGDRAYPEAV